MATLLENRGVTAKEIARMAGVGIGTVSRVLNSAPNVSPKMRDKVLQVIGATGYRPCSAARTMSSRRYGTIGLVSEIELEDTYYGMILQSGMCEELTTRDLRLAMGFVHMGAGATDLMKLPILRTRSIDGVVLDLHLFAGDLAATAAQLGIPYVSVNPSADSRFNAIVPEDVDAAAQAVDYLLQRGHRRIAYLPGWSKSTHSSQVRRIQGYLNGMARAGLVPLPQTSEILPPEDVEKNVMERVRLWTQEHGCTAMVVYNSLYMARVFRCCYELGLRVPADLSLISCDYEPILEQLPVPVTYVKLDRRQMGCAAVEMVLERVQQSGKDLPSRVMRGELHELSSVRTL